ncbi:hypothetical protein [Oceanomicrobium pacificus]|uniref:DUF2497 domain-containing protein n=1 Tax=Oceanomicrobium pacificus TaxID=2692916 RepID=A0A6B0TXQ7_9RHOB|nr:hypothetical protein [Oceanomicrobium pacificus]MXU66072.1 hypothetical protein [Oceanomicrobium pacificus]
MSPPDPRDVNDVLSSIRQLVSAEARALDDRKVVNEIKDMLVLTDDKRVAAAAPAAQPLVLGPADAARPGSAPAGPVGDQQLRRLVREILNEELQGELGDRITRNVRKLVRREIARVLSEDLSE